MSVADNDSDGELEVLMTGEDGNSDSSLVLSLRPPYWYLSCRMCAG